MSIHAMNSSHTEQPPPRIAALLYEPGDPVEAVMAEIARTLRDRGVHVGGLLQHSVRDHAEARCQINLENVGNGTLYPLTQNLGVESQSCALDITALADASAVVRQAVDDQARIVIVNKFGAQEAIGGGLRDEMMQVALAGIPLLTSVGRRFLPQWQEFIGEDALLLSVSLDVGLAWWKQVQPLRHLAAESQA
jgi:nucleoside-triphosphatase THEP1